MTAARKRVAGFQRVEKLLLKKELEHLVGAKIREEDIVRMRNEVIIFNKAVIITQGINN